MKTLQAKAKNDDMHSVITHARYTAVEIFVSFSTEFNDLSNYYPLNLHAGI